MAYTAKHVVDTQYWKASLLAYVPRDWEENGVLGWMVMVWFANKLIVSFSDLDGTLLSGPDGDRTVNTNLLAEACSGQDAGDAGRYSNIF